MKSAVDRGAEWVQLFVEASHRRLEAVGGPRELTSPPVDDLGSGDDLESVLAPELLVRPAKLWAVEARRVADLGHLLAAYLELLLDLFDLG